MSKRDYFWIVFVLVTLLVGWPADASDDRGWQVGGGYGNIDTHYGVGAFGYGPVGFFSIDNDDSGWKLFLGYDFNRYFAIEAGYVDFNADFDGVVTFFGIGSDTISVDVEPSGLFGAAVGRLRLGSRFSLHGRLGLVGWRARVSVIDSNGFLRADDDGVDGMFGLGAELDVIGGLALRAELDVFGDVWRGTVWLGSVGAVYRF